MDIKNSRNINGTIVDEMIAKVSKEIGVKMENLEKVDRAVIGVSTSRGRVEGVGEDASAKVVIAKYDSLAGFITMDGVKVKNGSFFDRRTKKPVNKPKLILLIKVNGEVVEQEVGKEESVIVKVAKGQAKVAKAKLKAGKKLNKKIEKSEEIPAE